MGVNGAQTGQPVVVLFGCALCENECVHATYFETDTKAQISAAKSRQADTRLPVEGFSMSGGLLPLPVTRPQVFVQE